MKAPWRDSGRRTALTLIELLVVVGIIGVLAGLLLPAVQAAREASRRVRCAHNLGQLIRATHLFEANRGGFPPAASAGGPPALPGRPYVHGLYSVQCMLLPYLERGALYDSMNLPAPTGGNLPSVGIYHRTAAIQAVDVFLCPSDSTRGTQPLAPNSYRACTGFGETRTLTNGLILILSEGAFSWMYESPRSAILPLSEFSDGLSSTLAFSEKPIGSGSAGPYHPFRDWSLLQGGVIISSKSEWVRLCSTLKTPDPRFDAGGTWLLPGTLYTHFYATEAPNSLIPDCGDDGFNIGIGIYSARSYHPGGVNAAMADGSVRWFGAGTHTEIWRALGTRSGGEPAAP